MGEKKGYCRASLASSRVSRGRVGRRAKVPSREIVGAGAVVAPMSSSVAVVSWEVSMAEESKTDEGSGEADWRMSGAEEG